MFKRTATGPSLSGRESPHLSPDTISVVFSTEFNKLFESFLDMTRLQKDLAYWGRLLSDPAYNLCPQEQAFVAKFDGWVRSGSMRFSLGFMLLPLMEEAEKASNAMRIYYMESLVDRYSDVYTKKFFLLFKNTSGIDRSSYQSLLRSGTAFLKQEEEGMPQKKAEVNFLQRWLSKKAVPPQVGQKRSALFEIFKLYKQAVSPQEKDALKKRLEEETIYRGSLLDTLKESFPRFLRSEYWTLQHMLVEDAIAERNFQYTEAILSAPYLTDALKESYVNRLLEDRQSSGITAHILDILGHPSLSESLQASCFSVFWNGASVEDGCEFVLKMGQKVGAQTLWDTSRYPVVCRDVLTRFLDSKDVLFHFLHQDRDVAPSVRKTALEKLKTKFQPESAIRALRNIHSSVRGDYALELMSSADSVAQVSACFQGAILTLSNAEQWFGLLEKVIAHPKVGEHLALPDTGGVQAWASLFPNVSLPFGLGETRIYTVAHTSVFLSLYTIQAFDAALAEGKPQTLASRREQVIQELAKQQVFILRNTFYRLPMPLVKTVFNADKNLFFRTGNPHGLTGNRWSEAAKGLWINTQMAEMTGKMDMRFFGISERATPTAETADFVERHIAQCEQAASQGKNQHSFDQVIYEGLRELEGSFVPAKTVVGETNTGGYQWIQHKAVQMDSITAYAFLEAVLERGFR